MNVKCPKCRFKFDAPTADINDSNEVSIICPRCGHAFITAPQPLTEPAENKQDEPLLIKPERTEAELYFSAVNFKNPLTAFLASSKEL